MQWLGIAAKNIVPAISDEIEAVILSQDKKTGCVEFGRHDDCDGLRQHELIRQLRVQVHGGEERRLAWVGVNLSEKQIRNF